MARQDKPGMDAASWARVLAALGPMPMNFRAVAALDPVAGMLAEVNS